jgi:hypothetical protein
MLLIMNLWDQSADLIFACFNQGRTAGFFPLVSLSRLFELVPFLTCAVLLATGRLNLARKTLPALFSSRFWLAGIAIVWTLFFLTGYRILWEHVIASPPARAFFWGYKLNDLIWPSMLLGLLLWLMPHRKSRVLMPA